MNPIETFAHLVGQNPDDKTTALVAVDYLHENENQTRTQALRNVGRWRKDARAAKQLAAAAAALRTSAEYSNQLRTLVIMASEVNDNLPVTIYPIPGRKFPEASQCEYVGNGVLYGYWSITVGALWVLAALRGLENPFNPPDMPSWAFPPSAEDE
jgi:hypothetical protein